jgi:prevent-host-death family protein
MTQYSIAQVQENPEDIIQTLEREKAVEITQQGKQVAVLLSVDEYERLVGEKQSGLMARWQSFVKSCWKRSLILTQMRCLRMYGINRLDVRFVCESLLSVRYKYSV